MYLLHHLKENDISVITTSHKAPIDLFICDEHLYREYAVELKTILNGDFKTHMNKQAINRKNRESRKWGIKPAKRITIVVRLKRDLSLREIIYATGFKNHGQDKFRDDSKLIDKIKSECGE